MLETTLTQPASPWLYTVSVCSVCRELGGCVFEVVFGCIRLVFGVVCGSHSGRVDWERGECMCVLLGY